MAQPPAAAATGQHGAALLLVLLTLSVLLLLSGGAANSILLGEKMLRNAQDRAHAFQAAEAALSDAEDDIRRSRRASLFTPQNMQAFPAEPGCGGGETLGLCLATPGRMIWQDMDLSQVTGAGVPYGHFTGNHYAAENGTPATPPPRYLIELMRNVTPVAGTTTDHLSLRYRITAIGFNQRATAHVLLEKIVQKE
ncbi:pilus assembly PilX family protein [Herbaspirillum autotrophicum]|uniref:pilus assembly PilX family protein n=1 Tax=Herbaspirillum autotrophicum TaxID=180195 RepID=UPI0018DE2B24|nr:pilus assembly protein [Herbaspirillum autotrophicum]